MARLDRLLPVDLASKEAHLPSDIRRVCDECGLSDLHRWPGDECV